MSYYKLANAKSLVSEHIFVSEASLEYLQRIFREIPNLKSSSSNKPWGCRYLYCPARGKSILFAVVDRIQNPTTIPEQRKGEQHVRRHTSIIRTLLVRRLALVLNPSKVLGSAVH